MVEVDLTSSTRKEDYQAIGAPELWIYCQNKLLIYHFDGQQYQACQTSQQFPDMDIKTLIATYVDRSWKVGSSAALREFEYFLRNLPELDSSV